MRAISRAVTCVRAAAKMRTNFGAVARFGATAGRGSALGTRAFALTPRGCRPLSSLATRKLEKFRQSKAGGDRSFTSPARPVDTVPPRRPTPSEKGQEVAKKFVDENEQITNERPSVQWFREPDMDAYAAELLDHHEGSLELDQLEKEAKERGASLPPGEPSTNGTVEHLGEGVYLGRTKLAEGSWIDHDSKRNRHTITRVDQRVTGRLAIGTVDDPRNFPKVTVIGQPGIGKTRGGLTYVLEELLWRGEAVLRVGFKNNTVYAFLPDENGVYRVWRTEAEGWNSSEMAHDPRAYALIDPPEKPVGGYADAANCHVIKVASNNVKHYYNVIKTGKLLVSALVTRKEVLVMTPILWNGETTPYPHQVAGNDPDPFASLEAKQAEIIQRCELAGTVLRYVFDHKNFTDHLDKVVTAAAEDRLVKEPGKPAARRFVEYVWGTVTTTVGDETSASSIRYLLDSVPGDPTKTKMHLKLAPAALHVLRLELKKMIAETVWQDAYDFEETTSFMLQVGGTIEVGGAGKMTFPSRTLVTPRPGDQKATAEAILDLPDSGEQLVIANTGFPVLDQAASRFEWFNAKTGAGAPTVTAGAFHSLMTKELKMAVTNEQGGLTLVDDYAARAETLKGSGKKLITLHFFMPNVPESRTPNQHIFENNTGKGGPRSLTIPQLQEKLEEAGLLQGGKKPELLKRLEDHMNAQHEKVKDGLKRLTVPKLKVKLKEAGLLQGGKKLELRTRLEDHIDAQHEKNIEGIAIDIEEKAINFELLEAFFKQHVDVITVDCSKIHHGPADPAAMEHLGQYSPKYARTYRKTPIPAT